MWPTTSPPNPSARWSGSKTPDQRQAQLAADHAHLVLVQQLHRLHQLELQIVGQAANVGAWQYFAVVPDMRATGVRDGVRAYEWPAIIRALNTAPRKSSNDAGLIALDTLVLSKEDF